MTKKKLETKNKFLSFSTCLFFLLSVTEMNFSQVSSLLADWPCESLLIGNTILKMLIQLNIIIMAWIWTILFPTFTFSLFPLFVHLTFFFSCCKVHDFCEKALLDDADKCNVNRGTIFITKDFKYNKVTNKCCEYKLDFIYFFFLFESVCSFFFFLLEALL